MTFFFLLSPKLWDLRLSEPSYEPFPRRSYHDKFKFELTVPVERIYV